jgi:hypothetical protein
MKNYVRLLTCIAGVLGLLLTLSGCGTKHVDTIQSMNLSKSDMKYKNVYVANFIVSPKGVKEDDPKSILADAQSECANALTKSNLFENVKYGSKVEETNSSLIVQGELTELRIVGGAARFWIGGLAGKSNMTVHVKLVDAATGSVVTEKDIKEDSNPTLGGYTMGATDRALPTIVGSLIAEYAVATAKR